MSTDRRALLVGIEDYDFENDFRQLKGCAEDARRMSEILKYHDNTENNFDCKLITSELVAVKRVVLRDQLTNLFIGFKGDILFYFSGHGMPSLTGGYLVTQDGSRNDPGLPMNDLVVLANQSSAQSVLIILDCCYAGAAGDYPGTTASELREGVTVLAGANSREKAQMIGERSIFTDLVIGALEGGAANVEGQVTAASIYAYVESSLGAFEQRPIYKSYARKLDPVRKCEPLVDSRTMKEVMKLFSAPDVEFPLDPDYEGYCLRTLPPKYTNDEAVDQHCGDPAKRKIRDKFKNCQIAGLLKPKYRKDLFWAALYSEPIVLTPLGKYYWKRKMG